MNRYDTISDPSYVAVGIPQGVIADPVSGDAAGAVRRGGEIVSLDKIDYGIWTVLLAPMTVKTATEFATSRTWGELEQAIARLEKLGLLATLEPGKPMGTDVAELRPIPLGVGLGNTGSDPVRFEVQNSALSLPSPVSLDVVGVMFWWEFDGTRSLREIVGRIVGQVGGLSVDSAETVVTKLVHGLMASRLLYLDYPLSSGSAMPNG